VASLVETLAAGAVYSEDGFLAADEVAALRGALLQRLRRGELSAAQIGVGSTRRLRSDLRGDSISWLDPPRLPVEALLWARLEALRLALNRELGLGLFELEMHYAHYPPGARYARHLDQPRSSADRIVSFILYLNDAWAAEAGGALRLYGARGGFEDILPLGGRLVAFLSAEREHEVLPVKRDRLSVTGWFRRRGQRVVAAQQLETARTGLAPGPVRSTNLTPCQS
jgi:SM-20-related protein